MRNSPSEFERIARQRVNRLAFRRFLLSCGVSVFLILLLCRPILLELRSASFGRWLAYSLFVLAPIPAYMPLWRWFLRSVLFLGVSICFFIICYLYEAANDPCSHGLNDLGLALYLTFIVTIFVGFCILRFTITGLQSLVNYSIRTIGFGTVLVWVSLCATHCFLYANSIVINKREDFDTYICTWCLQIAKFMIFRFPFWIIILMAFRLFAEAHWLSRKNKKMGIMKQPKGEPGNAPS